MFARFATALFFALPCLQAAAQTPAAPIEISVKWDDVVQVQKSTPTLQIVVNPKILRGSPIHDAVFANLQALGCDYVRYVPWYPYPRMAVAELEPPTATATSWDFTHIDPETLDFFHATEGHSRIVNFSTIPDWMFVQKQPAVYPKDPLQVTWSYTQGKVLRDPTGKELAGYYTRLVSWYTKGGFTDELGKRHESGYHFQIPYWEFLNEIDAEHQPSPELYNKEYDAVVGALHQLDPRMKFVGLALAFPERDPQRIEYFLDHAHHAPGIPLDMISYHFYANPAGGEPEEAWQYDLFSKADQFVVTMRFVEAIRRRESPQTQTDLDEIGTILPTDWHPDTPYGVDPPIPEMYWKLSGAIYAYLYLEAAKMGIDVVGESQLVGYPSQFPSVTMLDWNSGRPNARYNALKLLRENMHPGDPLLKTVVTGSDINALAFRHGGVAEILLVNKRDRPVAVQLPGEFAKSHATGSESPLLSLADGVLTLPAFGVVIIQ